MNTRIRPILLLLALSGIASQAGAHPAYVGYSGAPGSNGRCASSCHGSSGGTIQVSGFPTTYSPGQAYTVSFAHNGGAMIKQLNGSCRVGTTSANAGVITAGTSTVTYNTQGETNGFHLTTQDIMGGDFVWTAPDAGAGDVTLYIAGHQGTSGGANTNIVLTASEEVAGVNPGTLPGLHDGFVLYNTFPNPFRGQTAIGFVLPQAAPVVFEIYNTSGQRVEYQRSEMQAGFHELSWNGAAYPSGIYFCRIQAGALSDTRKMVLDK